MKAAEFQDTVKISPVEAPWTMDDFTTVNGTNQNEEQVTLYFVDWWIYIWDNLKRNSKFFRETR